MSKRIRIINKIGICILSISVLINILYFIDRRREWFSADIRKYTFVAKQEEYFMISSMMGYIKVYYDGEFMFEISQNIDLSDELTQENYKIEEFDEYVKLTFYNDFGDFQAAYRFYDSDYE